MALRQTKKERFSAALIHLKEIQPKLGKMHTPQSQLIDWGNLGSYRARKETRRHANQYIAAAGGFSNRGNLDSPCSETIELYRCRLSHYIWHPRVDALIGTRIFLE